MLGRWVRGGPRPPCHYPQWPPHGQRCATARNRATRKGFAADTGSEGPPRWSRPRPIRPQPASRRRLPSPSAYAGILPAGPSHPRRPHPPRPLIPRVPRRPVPVIPPPGVHHHRYHGVLAPMRGPETGRRPRPRRRHRRRRSPRTTREEHADTSTGAVARSRWPDSWLASTRPSPSAAPSAALQCASSPSSRPRTRRRHPPPPRPAPRPAPTFPPARLRPGRGFLHAGGGFLPADNLDQTPAFDPADHVPERFRGAWKPWIRRSAGFFRSPARWTAISPP
jgi:hypothetical protein